MRIESVRGMNKVTANVRSPAFPPAMQKLDPSGVHFDFIFITYMAVVLCYSLYMPLLSVEMGNRHGKGWRKCKCSPQNKLRGFAPTWLKNITVRGILEKSWLAHAVETGFAQAGLSRPAKAEPDER